MRKNKNVEKIEFLIFVFLITVILLFIAMFIYELIDFKNDYECSTTSDINWYIEHDCMKYERRNYNE